MTNTVKKETWKEFLIRTLADPVLIYAVIAMMSIMNHYRSQLTLMYGIGAYVAGWLIFRLFDYINKHHVIGTFLYIILFTLFMMFTRSAIDIGSIDYPISWGLWFLTPQDVLQYNKWFTFSIFLLFLIFMLSVIYYFTRVRYRLFMNFLILIIPFSIYGKENEEMSIGFIVALCVGFFIVLANFRQMSDNSETTAVDKHEMWRSAAVFTVLFALVSSLIPKPQVEADRTMIETLINAEALTDKFLNMLSAFRTDTSGELFRNNVTNTPLYYAISPSPLQLKTTTYTTYDFDTDSWKVGDVDEKLYINRFSPVDINYDGSMLEALLAAADIDSGFSAKYGLDDLKGLDYSFPKEQRLAINAINNRGNAAPVPAGASALTGTSFEGAVGVTDAGTIYADETTFGAAENFSFSFVLPTFFMNEANCTAYSFLDSIPQETYNALVYEASGILSKYYYGDASDELSEEKYARLAKLEDYLNDEAFRCGQAYNKYLYYGRDERIRELAEQITEGCETDYEKAKALEYYFLQNGFNYDLSYRKEVGENVDDFLFRTKTGVCYEYATAMTLMSRAVGIPARYCEGYNMQTKSGDESSNRYIISTNDAHGFPELYIKGYGWMTFEPTMTNGITRTEEKSATSLLSSVGIMILIGSAAAVILILLYPTVSNGIFLMIVRRRSPNDAVSAAVKRICRLYGIPRTASVHEAEAEVYRRSKVDIAAVSAMFDRAEYGGAVLTDDDRTKAIEEYVSAYKALGEAKKAERKARKKRFAK